MNKPIKLLRRIINADSKDHSLKEQKVLDSKNSTIKINWCLINSVSIQCFLFSSVDQFCCFNCYR